jgi:HEAT repeat protein
LPPLVKTTAANGQSDFPSPVSLKLPLTVMERFSEASFIELLIALSGDTSSTVRNAAAGALSQMAAAGEAPENVIQLLARLLASSGRDLAVVIVSRLVSQSTSNGGNKELLELAQQHPAARVRREATVLTIGGCCVC